MTVVPRVLFEPLPSSHNDDCITKTFFLDLTKAYIVDKPSNDGELDDIFMDSL